MEDQTRFDLNAAIEAWRRELAEQPDLLPDERRELETHLRDAVAGLRRQGLNDEESFWLARRRVGRPWEIAEEFTKADPARAWRERVFWMAVALVGSYVFMTWKDLFATWLNPDNYLWSEWLYLIPLFIVIMSVVMIRRGRIPNPNRMENSSSWKLAGGLFAILTGTLLSAYFRSRNLPVVGILGAGFNVGMTLSWFSTAVWPLVAVLILLLTLKRDRKKPKSA